MVNVSRRLVVLIIKYRMEKLPGQSMQSDRQVRLDPGTSTLQKFIDNSPDFMWEVNENLKFFFKSEI